MKVFLNNSEICVGKRVTLRDLLAGQGITPVGIAAAVNNVIIPKDEWVSKFLANGDKVTIIRATYGG
ncbi:MAG: sulfur carrier protein ThiS [Bacteroidaceae bacterium]|nr:sulfur carrier protein ThiS [Bacteroidaceae bacterium]